MNGYHPGPALTLAAHPDSAVRLLGSVLFTPSAAGRIIETEFYDQSDPASHTFGGRTARNAPMFERTGTLYVYRSYGLHWCANVAVGDPGRGSAVLIRALEPLAGVDAMWSRRPRARRATDLCSGPGKLCAALGIDGSHSGTNLFDARGPVGLAVAEQPAPEDVAVGVRVGISKAVDRPWRFALDSPHRSGPSLG